jgi:hypothetical protein
MIPGVTVPQSNDSTAAAIGPGASIAMDPMLYALINSQDSNRAVRD